MIINTSNTEMNANSARSERLSRKFEQIFTNKRTGSVRYFSSEFETETTDMENVWGRKPVTIQDQLMQAREFMNRLREYIMSIRERIFGGFGVYGASNNLFGYGNVPTYDLRSGSYPGANVWHRVDHTTYEYHEEECMTFATVGQVQTADGRTIDFDLTMNLSREFTQQADTLVEGVEVIMTDPIVISLDGFPPAIADKTWSFDIDADGVKDNIPELMRGAGYLAFDRNKDGIINDGSELFGARTGNGFAELALLDSDGNGWIDEADEAFDMLSVWAKDASGLNRMMSLREANVGAILLDSLDTRFSHKSEEDNSMLAQVKRSGMYLTEDGLARGMQQIDFVKSA